MSTITSKYASAQFWVDVADRAVSTFAQAAVAALGADAAGILAVDFSQVASVAGLAAAVSVLTSVAFRGRDTAKDAGTAAAAPVTPVSTPIDHSLKN